MSTENLRDELARIASRAPQVDVPEQTWRRARRARRRGLLVTSVAAVAAVAVLAGAASAWLPGDYETPPADGGGSGAPALPDRLYDVPAGFADDRATTDLAVGRGAVAWFTDSAVAVVVDADAGDYHLLRLPDAADLAPGVSRTNGASLAVLSPDGTMLAYPRDDGLGLVDLASGEVRQVDASDGPDVFSIERLVFSASGGYLAWLGSPPTGGDGSAVSVVAGVVDVGTGEASGVPLTSGDVAISVTDAGRLEPVTQAGSFPPSPVAVLDGAGTALLGNGQASGRGAPGAALVRQPGVEGEGVVQQADRGGRATVPLGWSADGLPLVAVSPGDVTRVVLFDAGGDRTVATTEPGVPVTLSIAADLVTAAQPSVARPDPGFPASHERLWTFLVTAGIVVALVALMALTAGAWSNRFSGAASANPFRRDV